MSRITPAYAGTTIKCVENADDNEDHPRLRGNHCILRWPSTGFLGSPPLTREPLSTLPSTFSTLRITPAYAGTTRPRKLPLLAFEDHPRLRGNHRRKSAAISGRRGSPPLTREPPAKAGLSKSELGITPAYAGTTMLCTLRRASLQDHPRLRGNHYDLALLPTLLQGSPPLTREPRGKVLEDLPDCGITPAYAGTTCIPHKNRPQLWDHPRLRGNHLWRRRYNEPGEGSPPLTREPPR